MVLKTFERAALLILLAATLGAFLIGCCSLSVGAPNSGKWLASAGLLATAAGVFQLEVSGLFQKIMDFYSDEMKFPYGPPSHITRQIIDDVDHPIRTWLRNACFFNVSTGFWLIIGGTLVQVFAAWA